MFERKISIFFIFINIRQKNLGQGEVSGKLSQQNKFVNIFFFKYRTKLRKNKKKNIADKHHEFNMRFYIKKQESVHFIYNPTLFHITML